LTETILAIDIGNSSVVIGAWANDQWQHIWPTPSRPDPVDIYHQKIGEFLRIFSSPPSAWRIVVSSVVPAMAPRLVQALAQPNGEVPLLLGPAVYPALGLVAMSGSPSCPTAVFPALAPVLRLAKLRFNNSSVDDLVYTPEGAEMMPDLWLTSEPVSVSGGGLAG